MARPRSLLRSRGYHPSTNPYRLRSFAPVGAAGHERKVPLAEVEACVTCSYDNLLAIDEALIGLEQAEPRAARVTELHFFGGLELKEIGELLDVSEITVKRDWKFARAWLATRLR